MTDFPSTHGTPGDDRHFKVLIAGGGVAGLEAAFALRELAGDRVDLSILAPTEEFVYRPMSIAEPFSSGWAQRYPLSSLADAADATLIHDTLAEVDVAHQTAYTASGEHLSYDALMICLGTTSEKRYEHATTMDDTDMDELLRGLVQDIEGGYVHRLAIVVPAPMPWPLPAYELALMVSERAWDMQTDLSVTLLTPEKTPLGIFGADVSQELSRLLEDRNITVITSAYCEVPEAKMVRLHPGDQSLEVDRIVALPELRGPAVPGLPSDIGGFIPIDDYARVVGAKHVWAAGDATDFPIKHGGVAAQMADTAAGFIAKLAGSPIQVRKFSPVPQGVLLTGASPRLLKGQLAGARGVPDKLRKLHRGDVTPKIAARYLAPRLAGMSPEPFSSPPAAGQIVASR
jgi:sulfide:quinone oxidoreductase